MAIRVGLLKEVVAMAFDTVRTNKMRSGLTVLGVVIGITSIVGMTAMIRGLRRVAARFDQGDRAEPDHDPAGRADELRQRRRVRGDPAAAEPDGVRRPRDRKAGPLDPARGRAARRARAGAAHAGAGLLPGSADAGDYRFRHDRELRGGHAARPGRGAVLHGRRSAAPTERRGAGPDAVSRRCSRPQARTRSARWCASAPSATR